MVVFLKEWKNKIRAMIESPPTAPHGARCQSRHSFAFLSLNPS